MSDNLALARLDAPTVPVIARVHPLDTETVFAEFRHGLSVAEILGPGARCCRVEVGGMTLPEAWWPHVRPKPGTPVVITRFPEGGGSVKSIFRIIAFAALAIGVAAITAGVGAGFFAGVAGSLGIGGTFAAGTISAGLLAAGVGLVGSLAINALIPPSNANTTASASTDLLRSITGTSNQVNRFGAIPCVIGTILAYPPLAALPVTELLGDDQYLRMLFDLGSGDPSASDLKIGTTDLASYTDVQTEIGYNPTLFSQDILEVAAGQELDTDGTTGTRTSAASADEGSIDLAWAAGLFGVDKDGNTITVTCVVNVQFSPAGAGVWTNVTDAANLTISNYAASASGGSFHVVNGERKAIRVGLRWQYPSKGQYDVRVNRLSTDWGSAAADSRIGALTWTVLRTIRYDTVSTTGTKKLALRIKATDQLSGAINQFNCILAQPIPVWDTSTGTWLMEISDNPAFVFRWLLTACPANPRLVDPARIDDQAIKDWSVECAAKEFGYNNVLDQVTTVFALLKDVCAAGRATFTIREGKYSVVRDVAQTTPIQVFTPRNSWGFSGSRAFPDVVHALRVQIVNPEANYQQDEVIVYDDGYGAVAGTGIAQATKFEQMTLPGVTNVDAAWRLGRYHLAAGRLRPNTYFLSVDIENLVCNRGDLVLVANDVIAAGDSGMSCGRVASVTHDGSGNVTAITTDEGLDAVAGNSYVIRVRRNDLSVALCPVTPSHYGQGLHSLILTTPTAAINEGDLFVFAKLGQDTIPMIITKIEPAADFAAKLTLVDAAPAVLTADAGTPPAFVSQITGQPWMDAPPPPDLLVIDSGQISSYPNDAGTTSAAMSISVSGAWSGPSRPDPEQYRYQ